MKRQFQHEQHNRQERTWKERGNEGPHGSKRDEGKHKPHDWFWGSTISNGDIDFFREYRYDAALDRIQTHAEIVRCFVEYLRSRFIFAIPYDDRAFQYRFIDDVGTFSRINKLRPRKSKILFPLIQNEAEERLKIVESRVRKVVQHIDPVTLKELDFDRIFVAAEVEKSLPLHR